MNDTLKRKVYTLYYKGYPTYKIARILGITEANVVRILGR